MKRTRLRKRVSSAEVDAPVPCLRDRALNHLIRPGSDRTLSPQNSTASPPERPSNSTANCGDRAPGAREKAGLGTKPPTRPWVTYAHWWLVPAVALLLFDVPLCPWAGLLGWACPGCGLTRAALALLGGHFTAAWKLHPLVYVVLPCVAVVGAKAIVDATAQRRGGDTRPTVRADGRRRDRLLSVVAALGLALLIGVWVARAFGAFGGPVAVETYAQWAKRVVQRQ
jgi:hypothetical protein